MINFQPVKDAGLGPQDLCKLVNVTRVSCSNWLNGHVQPHHLLTDKVQKVVDDIAAALEAGLLPVPYNVTRRARAHYIETAIAKVHAQTPSA